MQAVILPTHEDPSRSVPRQQSAAIGESQPALACFAQSRPSNDKAKPELVPVLWLAGRVCPTHCVWPLKECGKPKQSFAELQVQYVCINNKRAQQAEGKGQTVGLLPARRIEGLSRDQEQTV